MKNFIKIFARKYLWVIVIIVMLIAIDLGIKAAVFGCLEVGDEIVVIKNLFSIRLTYNDGASFSILAGKIWLFVTLTICLLIILTFVYYRTSYKNSKFFSVAYALIYAGALGNFIDRIFIENVRDYLFIHFFPAIFNFADICIIVGAVMMVVFMLNIAFSKKPRVFIDRGIKPTDKEHLHKKMRENFSCEGEEIENDKTDCKTE